MEFAVNGVTTIEEANHFLENQFLPRFNDRFAQTPQDQKAAFRPLSPSLDLSTILCLKASRKSDAGGVISQLNGACHQSYRLLSNHFF
jgi:hypothetical protein